VTEITRDVAFFLLGREIVQCFSNTLEPPNLYEVSLIFRTTLPLSPKIFHLTCLLSRTHVVFMAKLFTKYEIFNSSKDIEKRAQAGEMKFV
jgi:hypothetical protein